MPRKIRVEMEPPRKGPIAGRTRFLLLVLVVFCLTINWANILTFSFTVICMHQSDGAQHEEAAREKRSTNHDEMPKAADRRFSPNSSGVDNNTSSAESDEMKKHNISQPTPTASEKDSTHAPGMANRTEKWLSIVKPNDASKKELPQNDDSSLTSFLTRELTNYEKSQAMAVVAAGALVANLPIVILINWYGPRTLFTVVGLLGAFATAMVPTAMKAGWNWFLFVRVLQGVAFAGDMATFGHFVVSWSYYKQYAFFTSTLCVYVQLAPIFTNPISGMLCNSPLGWPGVYYVHSGVAIFLFITFYVCYRNHPHQHPMVGDLEREKIGRGRDVIDHTAQRHVPYMSILKSPAAWAVFVGAIGNFAGINLLYQFTPTYLYKI